MRLLEATDLVDDLGAVPVHGIGMALGVLVLAVGQWGLGHQRAQAGIVGGLGQMTELLVGHGQLLAKLLEARADLGEASLDEGPGHRPQCTPDRGIPRICDHAPMPWSCTPWRRALAVAATLVTTVGCGGGSSSDGPCGPITREALDPAYLRHVLGDADDVEYTSDPPTSGPHQPAPPVEGVVEEPIRRPVQVGILERGDVLIQHEPDLDADTVQQLGELAGPRVVVAPNPDLPAPIVATGWIFKRTCDAVDRDALREFVEERVGKGPEG